MLRREERMEEGEDRVVDGEEVVVEVVAVARKRVMGWEGDGEAPAKRDMRREVRVMADAGIDAGLGCVWGWGRLGDWEVSRVGIRAIRVRRCVAVKK